VFGQRLVAATDSAVLLRIFGASANVTEPVLALFRNFLPRVKHLDLPLSGLVMTLDLLSALAERAVRLEC
jgi:uncharacterized protein YggT (Ycf19 family)